jgi:hypothetical protein
MELGCQLHALAALPFGGAAGPVWEGAENFRYDKKWNYLLSNNPSYQKIIALFDVSQVSAASSSDRSNVRVKMSKERCWNVTGTEESKYSEKNLFQCLFIC